MSIFVKVFVWLVQAFKPLVTLVKKRLVKARKAAMDKEVRSLGLKHSLHPNVCCIVQSFNNVGNVHNVISGVRKTCAEELILCEDGSIDGTLWTAVSRMLRPNDVVIRTNDVHELRAYDRAIRGSAAEFVCLLQDDDQLPADGSWLAELLGYFDEHPDLGIVGGFFAEMGDGKTVWGPYYFEKGKRTKRARQDFCFVACAGVGPFVFRKSCYEAIGGFDFNFAKEAGLPSPFFDYDLCFRAWKAGYSVGYRYIQLSSLPPGMYDQGGGTFLYGAETRKSQESNNQALCSSKHRDILPKVKNEVILRNKRYSTF